MNTPGSLTYVYAVTHRTGPLGDALAGLHGIGRAPLRFLPLTADTTEPAPSTSLASLAFVASDVAEQEFNETALKNHFEDLDWLEYVARTHHDVVQAVAARAPSCLCAWPPSTRTTTGPGRRSPPNRTSSASDSTSCAPTPSTG